MNARSGSQVGIPGWLREIQMTLAVTNQFVLTGNTRDLHITGLSDASPTGETTTQVLARLLSASGYDLVFAFDQVSGVRVVFDAHSAGSESFLAAHGSSRSASGALGRLGELVARAAEASAARVGIIVEFATRVWGDDAIGPDQRGLLATSEKLATGVENDAARPTIVWVCDDDEHIPSWLSSAPRARTVTVPLPNLSTRRAAAIHLLEAGADVSGLDAALIADFAISTEGLRLVTMRDAVHLVREHGLEVDRVAESVRLLQFGVLESPWHDKHLLERLTEGAERIGRRVVGQQQAVAHATDILVRAATGMNGAQSAQGHTGRPQGILFLAGPTGVGKTELAKALAELLFGDDDACVRFDMSEFSSEHSEARLIGAPPGYVGHGSGGELTNAVRQRPFCVLLFDEIEKAHPRILDKFLQILEDGRLTDGRGRTAVFSETVIVFTSNLGTVAAGGADDDASELQGKRAEAVREAITHHFTETINRPELLNRIGDNIVGFEPLSPATGRILAARYIDAVFGRALQRHGIHVSATPKARSRIIDIALEALAFGGRGIGARMESVLINPLSRHLFAHRGTIHDVVIRSVYRRGDTWHMTVNDNVINEEASDMPVRTEA